MTMPRLRISISSDAPEFARRWARWLCLAGAGVCFAYCIANWLTQHEYQTRAAESFEEFHIAETQQSHKRGEVRAAVAPPLAQLQIARLGLSGFIEDGLDSVTLGRAIGHWPGSAGLGETGNMVLAAHRDTFFSALKDARVGDVVTLRSPRQKVFQYRVTEIFVVDPSSTWVMEPTPGKNRLTLITCFPFRFVGTAPKRFVVLAEPLSAAGHRT